MISDDGFIRKGNYGSLKEPYGERYGPWKINFMKDRVKFTYYVHYLVAKHFLPGFVDGKPVKFKDGNPWDLRVENLYQKEN